LAFISVGLVVVIVLVFVIVKVTGSSSSSTQTAAAAPTPAPASLVDQVTNVSPAVEAAVGTGTGVTAPSVLNHEPPLVSNGKPEVLFIGAEFCPYCAAERWALIVALSHFGTFSGLKITTSSPWDAYPQTATFSFRDATYTSDQIVFTPVEHETNDVNGLGTHQPLEPLTPEQQNLWSKYSSQFGISTGYPFGSFGNRVFIIGPNYNPGVLQGLSQNEIAAKLSNPSDPVTQSIVGTANYLTAAVCAMTGNQPSSVCSAPGAHKAATALHLS
jgi:hypothetical protein